MLKQVCTYVYRNAVWMNVCIYVRMYDNAYDVGSTAAFIKETGIENVSWY